MISITAEVLMTIHEEVRKRYPDWISDGKTNRNMLVSIAENPFTNRYGYAPYDTIFKQAACLMENIIRLHPFPDGNKRTALLTTYIFLAVNEKYMVVPLDTIRFMVNVAESGARADDEVDRLVSDIAAWLEKRTATNDRKYRRTHFRYIVMPILALSLLAITGIGLIYVTRKMGHWFAFDTHPEYAKNSSETVKFLTGMTWNTFRTIQSKRKAAGQ